MLRDAAKEGARVMQAKKKKKDGPHELFEQINTTNDNNVSNSCKSHQQTANCSQPNQVPSAARVFSPDEQQVDSNNNNNNNNNLETNSSCTLAVCWSTCQADDDPKQHVAPSADRPGGDKLVAATMRQIGRQITGSSGSVAKALRQINIVGQLNHSACRGMLFLMNVQMVTTYLLALAISSQLLWGPVAQGAIWPFGGTLGLTNRSLISSPSLASGGISWPGSGVPLVGLPRRFARGQPPPAASTSVSDPIAGGYSISEQQQQSEPSKQTQQAPIEAAAKPEVQPMTQQFHYFWNHDQIEPKLMADEAQKILAEAQAQTDHNQLQAALSAGGRPASKQSASSRQDGGPMAAASESHPAVVVPPAIQQQLTAMVLQMQRQQQLSMLMQPRFDHRVPVGPAPMLVPPAPVASRRLSTGGGGAFSPAALAPLAAMRNYWLMAGSSPQPVLTVPPPTLAAGPPDMLVAAASAQNPFANPQHPSAAAAAPQAGNPPMLQPQAAMAGVPVYGPFMVAPNQQQQLVLTSARQQQLPSANHISHGHQPAASSRLASGLLLGRRMPWPLFGLGGTTSSVASSSGSLTLAASQPRATVALPPQAAQRSGPSAVARASLAPIVLPPESLALIDLASTQLANAILGQMQARSASAQQAMQQQQNFAATLVQLINAAQKIGGSVQQTNGHQQLYPSLHRAADQMQAASSAPVAVQYLSELAGQRSASDGQVPEQTFHSGPSGAAAPLNQVRNLQPPYSFQASAALDLANSLLSQYQLNSADIGHQSGGQQAQSFDHPNNGANLILGSNNSSPQPSGAATFGSRLKRRHLTNGSSARSSAGTANAHWPYVVPTGQLAPKLVLSGEQQPWPPRALGHGQAEESQQVEKTMANNVRLPLGGPGANWAQLNEDTMPRGANETSSSDQQQIPAARGPRKRKSPSMGQRQATRSARQMGTDSIQRQLFMLVATESPQLLQQPTSAKGPVDRLALKGTLASSLARGQHLGARADGRASFAGAGQPASANSLHIDASQLGSLFETDDHEQQTQVRRLKRSLGQHESSLDESRLERPSNGRFGRSLRPTDGWRSFGGGTSGGFSPMLALESQAGEPVARIAPPMGAKMSSSSSVQLASFDSSRRAKTPASSWSPAASKASSSASWSSLPTLVAAAAVAGTTSGAVGESSAANTLNTATAATPMLRRQAELSSPVTASTTQATIATAPAQQQQQAQTPPPSAGAGHHQTSAAASNASSSPPSQPLAAKPVAAGAGQSGSNRQDRSFKGKRIQQAASASQLHNPMGASVQASAADYRRPSAFRQSSVSVPFVPMAEQATSPGQASAQVDQQQRQHLAGQVGLSQASGSVDPMAASLSESARVVNYFANVENEALSPTARPTLDRADQQTGQEKAPPNGRSQGQVQVSPAPSVQPQINVGFPPPAKTSHPASPAPIQSHQPIGAHRFNETVLAAASSFSKQQSGNQQQQQLAGANNNLAPSWPAAGASSAQPLASDRLRHGAGDQPQVGPIKTFGSQQQQQQASNLARGRQQQQQQQQQLAAASNADISLAAAGNQLYAVKSGMTTGGGPGQVIPLQARKILLAGTGAPIVGSRVFTGTTSQRSGSILSALLGYDPTQRSSASPSSNILPRFVAPEPPVGPQQQQPPPGLGPAPVSPAGGGSAKSSQQQMDQTSSADQSFSNSNEEMPVPPPPQQSASQSGSSTGTFGSSLLHDDQQQLDLANNVATSQGYMTSTNSPGQEQYLGPNQELAASRMAAGMAVGFSDNNFGSRSQQNGSPGAGQQSTSGLEATGSEQASIELDRFPSNGNQQQQQQQQAGGFQLNQDQVNQLAQQQLFNGPTTAASPNQLMSQFNRSFSFDSQQQQQPSQQLPISDFGSSPAGPASGGQAQFVGQGQLLLSTTSSPLGSAVARDLASFSTQGLGLELARGSSAVGSGANHEPLVQAGPSWQQMQALGAAVSNYNQQRFSQQQPMDEPMRDPMQQAARGDAPDMDPQRNYYHADPQAFLSPQQEQPLSAARLSAASNQGLAGHHLFGLPAGPVDEEAAAGAAAAAGIATYPSAAQFVALQAATAAGHQPLSVSRNAQDFQHQALGQHHHLQHPLLVAGSENRDSDDSDASTTTKGKKKTKKTNFKQVSHHYHFNSFGSPFEDSENGSGLNPMNPLDVATSLMANEQQAQNERERAKEKARKQLEQEKQEEDQEKQPKKKGFLRRFSLKKFFKRFKKDKKKPENQADEQSETQSASNNDK